MSRAITLYLHIHQPLRVRSYSIFDTASSHEYFNESDPASQQNNEAVFRKVADKSYRPMNELLEKLIKKHPDFKLSLSITGTFIEQAEQWAPDVLESFQRLVKTGRVELLGETYYHSLAFFYDKAEFEAQVEQHRKKIKDVFGVEPQVFRNTELAYNDELATWADAKGYRGILAEGWDKILQGKSPNTSYLAADTKGLSLLLKNYQLSDDLAFRFSDREWENWPLTVPKYIDALNTSLDKGDFVNLFMDYETFGEHQWAETGIFSFFEEFVATWLADTKGAFYTVSDAIAATSPTEALSMPSTVTWADSERDLTAWTGNAMQQEALKHLYALSDDILRTKDATLISDWRNLQTSDHAYYMSTKWLTDGDVHAYFSPYDSPYDAFLAYINVIRDLRWRLHESHKTGGLNG